MMSIRPLEPGADIQIVEKPLLGQEAKAIAHRHLRPHRVLKRIGIFRRVQPIERLPLILKWKNYIAAHQGSVFDLCNDGI